MTVQSGQLYHVPKSGEHIAVLEQHPVVPRFWFTAVNQTRHIPIDVDGYVQQGLWILVQHSTTISAWYSAQAEQVAGSWAMVSTTGKIVRVTCIGHQPSGGNYRWSDKIHIGEVYCNTQHDAIDASTAQKRAISQSSHSAKAPKPLQVGDICPTCNKEWKLRELLTSSYVGCWCPTR